ncbi:hydroxyisourate hydrolase [Halalkalibacter wakoensis]|uniref:hydroxyisourate hydrolase n=1 Tax=Halalkalibacter wakoensis TaxID=127891 RepID=UPI001F1C650E|nr:hydroxyisourate hydrolase [Halalkalibacter wakoensis]
MEQKGKLTTHVLDISVGKPAAKVKISLLEVKEDQQLVKLGECTTNSDGRVDVPLLQAEEMKKGTFQLEFHVGDYYRMKDEKEHLPFLEVVPIRFVIANETEHYHVPLLLSPGGYSTYRGS